MYCLCDEKKLARKRKKAFVGLPSLPNLKEAEKIRTTALKVQNFNKNMKMPKKNKHEKSRHLKAQLEPNA